MLTSNFLPLDQRRRPSPHAEVSLQLAWGMSGTIKIPLFDLDLVNPAELMCHVFAMNWLILDIIDIQLILNKLNLAVPQHSWASPMQH